MELLIFLVEFVRNEGVWATIMLLSILFLKLCMISHTWNLFFSIYLIVVLFLPWQSAAEPSNGHGVVDSEDKDEPDEDSDDEGEEEEKTSSAKKIWRFLITWLSSAIGK